MEVFNSPFGEYRLDRYPLRQRETLRAWDAADELVLAKLAELFPEGLQGKSVLSVNDTFGALSTALNAFKPVSWGDSYLAQLATAHNYQSNAVDSKPTFLTSTERPAADPAWDVVLIKMPKTLALLDQQLATLRPFINEQTLLLGAGMVKHIHNSTSAAFEKWIGPTTTSLAKKKARLVLPVYSPALKVPAGNTHVTTFDVPEWGLTLKHEANVFSREHLDIGARFMLEQFKKLPTAEHIVDLGCGNGVLGCVAQQLQPNAQVSFVDESFMALASASENYQQLGMNNAQFFAGDSLRSLALRAEGGLFAPAADAAVGCNLILCNPPFHQQHTVGDQIAWQMFIDGAKALREGGQMWVIGNRHLDYHIKLKKPFSRVDMVASNKKFVVLRAEK